MILQGRFNSVFTPLSLQELSNQTTKSLYLDVDGSTEDPFPSAKTVSIEYRCERSYVRY